MSVAPALLARLSLAGRVVTGDALYCQRALCAQIVGAGGDYLVIVKRNQPQVYEAITLLFADPPPGDVFAVAEQYDRHGDRQEVRRLWASTALQGYLDWPGAQQVCKVERCSTQNGEVHTQVRYALTSLPAGVGAPTLLRHVRGHWGIENRVHYPRDVSMGEDASQVRTGAAPEALAIVRNVVLALLRQDGWTNIAAGLRHMAWRPQAAFRLLGLHLPP